MLERHSLVTNTPVLWTTHDSDKRSCVLDCLQEQYSGTAEVRITSPIFSQKVNLLNWGIAESSQKLISHASLKEQNKFLRYHGRFLATHQVLLYLTMLETID